MVSQGGQLSSNIFPRYNFLPRNWPPWEVVLEENPSIYNPTFGDLFKRRCFSFLGETGMVGRAPAAGVPAPPGLGDGVDRPVA